MKLRSVVAAGAVFVGCGSTSTADGGMTDSGAQEATDAGLADAGAIYEGGPADAGNNDAGSGDAGVADAGTPSATFADVFTILSNSCSGCHSADGAGGMSGLDFTDPTAAYSELINKLAMGQFCSSSPHTRVIPFDPTHSLLYQKVSGTQDCGSSMPWGEPPRRPPMLSSADQQTIYDWIAAGAVNSP